MYHPIYRVGAGMEPLMVVAMRGAPVKLTGVSAIVRSNSKPRADSAVRSIIDSF